ncbi:MAG TPA: amidohydrolase family protein [Gemmatimonadales bacterium]|nr:amidohydrolase family protein [Gemmatimonadales bacterium]
MSEAAARGIRVTGHIPQDVGLEAVLEAGQSSIAHVEEFFNKVLDRRLDDPRLSEVAARTSAAGIPVITTLVTYEAIAGSVAEDPSPLLNREAKRWIDPVRQLLWEPQYNRYRTPDRLGRDAEYRKTLSSLGYIARALYLAGVPLIAGSDAGEMPGLVPGADLHRELELLEAAGLSRFAVLQTATRNAGAYLDPDVGFGTIEVGKRADLILLDENPLESLKNLKNPAGVMTRGRWFSRSDIEAMLAGVRDINKRTGAFAELLLRQGIEAAERYVAGLGGEQPGFAESPALLLAFGLAQQGNLEGALRVVQLVARTYPDSYMPNYIMGVALMSAGHVADGRAALERVLEIVPNHDAARALLASTGGGP